MECIAVLRWSANYTSRGQFKSLTFGELDKFRRFGLTIPLYELVPLFEKHYTSLQ